MDLSQAQPDRLDPVADAAWWWVLNPGAAQPGLCSRPPHRAEVADFSVAVSSRKIFPIGFKTFPSGFSLVRKKLICGSDMHPIHPRNMVVCVGCFCLLKISR